MSLDGSVRRIVTGHEKNGASVVLFDGEAAKHVAPDATSWALWCTHSSPAKMAAKDMANESEFHPHGGNQLRIVEFGPTPPDIAAQIDPEFIIKMFRLEKFAERGKPVRHPLMHRTSSLDYAVVLSGECDMLTDLETTRVRPGDVIVQQATNHAWVNPTDKPCRILFVLSDGIDPLEKKTAKKPAKAQRKARVVSKKRKTARKAKRC